MKENKYDQPSFFQQYSQMPRSVEGLAAAGEWPALRALLPDFTGKKVLDLGCGFGWHCRYAAEQGAVEVLGTDLSENMLAKAREMTNSPVVQYQLAAIEDFPYPKQYYDIVISSLALHYVADIENVFQKIYNCLQPGGDFVFSAEHPVFTAYGTQNWYCDQKGDRLHWPVDDYFIPGKRTACFLGEEVVKYHRTLTDYIQALNQCGFRIVNLVEPQPSAELLRTVPGMEEELRRPMMLILAARKEQ